MSKSVSDLLRVGVVGGELEAVLARADVSEDVVVEGSWAHCWSMGMACCSEGSAGNNSHEVEHLHDPWRPWKHVYLSCIELTCDASKQCCHDHGWRCCRQVLQGAKEEVARVVVGWRDEQMAMSVLPTDVDVHNGEELLTVVVEEDDYC